MNTDKFRESAQGFAKSPLGIIALFIVLVYGFASLVVGLGQGISEHITPLVYFMVFFPVIVFCGFPWLVANHHNKLHGPSDFKNEDNFMKSQMTSVASLVTATAKHSGHDGELPESQLREIVSIVSNASKSQISSERRNGVLWIDDRPENIVHEVQAFQAQGVEFSLALSHQ